MSAPNTPMVKPTTNRTVAMDIPECGLDAVRDLARLAAATVTLSVAADPFEPLPDPLEPLPEPFEVGSVVAVPRTDWPAGAERTADAVCAPACPIRPTSPGLPSPEGATHSAWLGYLARGSPRS